MLRCSKTLGAVIPGAVLRLDNSTARTASVPSSATRRPSSSTVHSDWEGNFGRSHSTDAPSSISAGSPARDVIQNTDEMQRPELDKRDLLELPPCDEELARWFNIMPAQVVDKMFEYLATLNQHGQKESFSQRLRDANCTPHDKVRLAPPGDNNRHRSINPDVQEHLRFHMTSRATSNYPSRPFEPLSPQSPSEETCPSTYTGSQTNMSLLQQLRDSHAAASRTMSMLETTIRKVDSQLANERVPRPNTTAICRLPLPLTTSTMATTGSFSPSSTTPRRAPSTLTPPPDNHNSYSMTLEQLEKLFAPSAHREAGVSNLEYRVPKSQQGDGVVTKTESVADGGLGHSRAHGHANNNGHGHGHATAREEDLQEAFDSLIDFGGGDALFQNLDLGIA